MSQLKPITPDTFPEARTALREGKEFLLVCVKPLRGFVVGRGYPVLDADDECNLTVQERKSGQKCILRADGCAGERVERKLLSDMGGILEMAVKAVSTSNPVEHFQVADSWEAVLDFQKEQVDELSSWLVGSYNIFSQQNVFAPGDLVMWKSGMRDRTIPEYDQPVVVLEVLSELKDESEIDTSNQYAAARLDLVIGIKAPSGEFLHYFADSRRYQHFEMH